MSSMKKTSLEVVPDNKMAPVSYLLYTIGIIGTGVGVFTALAEPSTGVFLGNSVGSGLLLASVGTLWCALFLESLVPIFD
jgi:flagellar motor component MotA